MSNMVVGDPSVRTFAPEAEAASRIATQRLTMQEVSIDI